MCGEVIVNEVDFCGGVGVFEYCIVLLLDFVCGLLCMCGYGKVIVVVYCEWCEGVVGWVLSGWMMVLL